MGRARAGRWDGRESPPGDAAAWRGEPAGTAELATKVLEPAESSARGWDWLEAARATPIAALLERDPERASTSLGAVWEHTLRAGVDDPGAFPVAGDLVEALVELGRSDAANEGIERVDRLPSRPQRPGALPT